MKLVTTSVVRGSRPGDSHGAIYLIDLDAKRVERTVDWRHPDIDWRGHGGDRGLRGIAFDRDTVYIAASGELLAFSPDFKPVGRWRNPWLRYCHEIAVYERTLYLVSTGFDSILGFHLDEHRFDWAMQVVTQQHRFAGRHFDPAGEDGPLPVEQLHLNSVHCNAHGMYIGGVHTGGMLHFNGKSVNMAVQLPCGTHNARPFRDGVLFNDADAGRLCFSDREGREDRAMPVPAYGEAAAVEAEPEGTAVARPGFARGLCVLSGSVVAGGSAPAAVTVYDLAGNRQVLSVGLTTDVRHAIHGLEVWPFD